jgi:hypothetical protein
MLGVVGVLLVASVAAAQVPQLNVSVETDKASYLPGEEVSWTMYAYTGPAGNSGVALLALNLGDSTADTLVGPDIEMIGFPVAAPSFVNGGYSLYQAFIMEGQGTIDVDGSIKDMTVRQGDATRMLNIGNGDQPVIFAQGAYTPTTLGEHTLEVSINGANYWSSDTGPAMAFDAGSNTPAVFTVEGVIPEPATMALLGLGLGGLAIIRRRRA